MKNKNYTNKNVKYLREYKQVPQNKMSKELNIDQSTLAKWENGTRQITLDWAIKLADYFDVPVGDFISKDFLLNSSTSSEKKESKKKKEDKK